MRKLYLFYLILSLSFFLNKTYATHALGGDLMYTQLSPTEFEVTLRIYRDCNGINLNNSTDIYWYSSCGSGSVVADRISNIDITPLCPGLPTACQGGSGSIGIEEHIYTTIVTLPAGCTDVTFDYTLCCRNHIITTLVDPGNENIYLSTSHLSLSNTLNNSPIFNNYPSPIVCVNQPVVYNHGVFDPDGDSLYFSPNNCYEALNDTVEYLPGFNGITPLITANPIQINPNTGSITFTPTAQQVGVMCILVEEFRDGIKIGETLRDIQFNVIACNNIPPVASGINNVPGVDSLNFVISVCENSQICFDLSFSDSDNDNLNVSWNQEIPTATFQVFNNGTQTPTGQFCWLPQASDVGSNFFSINITDDACPLVGSSTYTYTVDVLPNPNTMSLAYNDLVCTGGVGSISLTASATPDSVYWATSPSLTVVNDTFVNVSPTFTETFGVLVMFSGSCQLTESATIGISPPPTIQGMANTSNLCAGGTVVLSGSGGDTYTWNNGVTDNMPFTPPIGLTDFIVTGVDTVGCSNTDTVQITVNPIIGINATPGSSLCYGDSLSLSGYGAQSYAWTNGVVDGVPFLPPAGTSTYIMTGTDVNGCTAMDTIDIFVNPLPLVSAIVSSDSICIGDSITLNSSGASTYTWSNGVNNGDYLVPSLGLTTFTVTGTDVYGCENTANTEVFVNPLPNISITASGNNFCAGDNLVLHANGADSYSWSNGIVNGQSFLPPIGTDTFEVIGVDINGCINQNSSVITTFALPNISASTSANNICEGQSIVLTGSGGQNYTWSNGVIDGQSFIPPVGNTWYELTGIDSNGCVNTDSIEIHVNPNPTVTAIASNNNICENSSLVLTATGASTYVWNNGVSPGQSFVPNVGASNYSVIGTDVNGCIDEDTIGITVFPLPTIQISASDIAVCEGSPVSLTASGASSYSWTSGVINGASFVPPVGVTSYSVSASDVNGCMAEDSIELLVYALPNVMAYADNNEICVGNSVVVYGSGAESYVWDNGVQDSISFTPAAGNTSYTVTGTDVNGCVGQDNLTIQVNALPNIAVYTSGNNVCEGESIALNGSGALSFVWNNGVVDGLSFVPPIGLTTYSVNATDTNGCSQMDSIDIQVNALPIVGANATAQALCAGDSVSLTGTGAQSYVWDNGVQDGVSFVPSAAVTSYEVTGTDANGCVNTANISLTIHALPNVEANVTNSQVCSGNSTTLYGSGAQSYIWDNGITDNMDFTPLLGTTTYTVIGTDMYGCQEQDTISITSLALPIPVISASSSGNSVCDGESITLTASGAQSYSWNNGIQNGVSFQAPLGATTYMVNATDTNGCMQNDSILIQVNPLPNIVINASSPAVCEGSAVTLSGSGAQSYVWDNGVQDGVSFVPSASIAAYQVIGTDSNGCVNNASVSLTIHPLPDVIANATQSTICDGEEITLFGSGAQSYSWDNGVVDGQSFSPLAGFNSYTLTGTDTNACINTDTIGILTNDLPVIGLSSSSNTVCEDEAVTLNGTGGQTYVWTNGVVDGVSFIPPVGVNTYVVCGYDVNGCDGHDTIQVTVHPKPNVGINYSVTEICAGESAILNGTGAQTYAWNNGVIDGQSFTPPSGLPKYILTGTSSFGCTNQDSIILTVNPLPDIQITTSPNIICEGNMVSLSASGADTYQWSNGVVNNVPFLPGPGLNTFDVVGTDVNGCQNQLSTNIMVNPLPVVMANTSDNNICEGSSITLLGSGAQTYTWDNNVLQGVSFEPPVGTTTYEVTGTSVHGCQNTASIDIHVFPAPNVLALSTDMVICEGSPTSLYAQGASTYTWSNGITDGDTIYPALGTTTYEVVGQDANGCINQDTISIQVLRNGILNEMPDVSVCDVNNHILSTSSSYIEEYQWGIIVNSQLIDLPESSAYQGTQTDELTIVEIGQGIHTYYVQMEGLCGNELLDTVVLTIHEPTPIDALQDTTLCIHESNSLFADVEGSNIQWSDGTLGQYINPTNTGWYAVNFTEPNTGCQISDSMYVEMEDCIDQCVVLIPSGFSPNSDGVNDIFRSINTCNEGFSYYSLTIFDRWGGLVFQTDNPEEGWDGTRAGDKSALGVYVYNLAFTKEYNNEIEQIKGNVTLLY